MPVEAQDGGVVLGLVAAVGVGDRAHRGAHYLARMLGGGVTQEGGQIDALRLAFLHPVGVQQETVAGTQIQVLHPIGALPGHTEGQIDHQVQFVDPAVAQPQRPGVAGVDELGAAAVRGQAHELAGGKGPHGRGRRAPDGFDGPARRGPLRHGGRRARR